MSQLTSWPLRSRFEGLLACEGGQERHQDQTQKSPQPGEDEAEVVSDRGEDGVGGIAGAAFEMAAAEVTVGLHVPDHGFDCRAAPEFAFDHAKDAAFLSRDEDAPWVRRVVPTKPLVDLAALDGAAGEPFGGFDNAGEGVAIIRIARQRFGLQHELAAGSAGVGGDIAAPMPRAMDRIPSRSSRRACMILAAFPQLPL